jgi:hypothetical protein
VLVLAVLAAVLLAAPATAQTFGRSGVAVPTVLHAQMTGEQEVPPGDPDGFGSATVILSSPARICYVLTASNIAPANAAHIHLGAAGVAGPIVVPLAPPTFGVSGGCTMADPAVVANIRTNPSIYYVNVHNVPYPDGAIRGQLEM